MCEQKPHTSLKGKKEERNSVPDRRRKGAGSTKNPRGKVTLKKEREGERLYRRRMKKNEGEGKKYPHPLSESQKGGGERVY